MATSLEEAGAKSTTGAALGLGIAGTALGLGLLNGNGGLFGGNQNSQFVTKSELAYAQELAKKDSEIALLKSEQNTEIKIADVYERIMTRVNSDARQQADWNAQQAVNNAQMAASISVNANSIAGLQNCCNQITKLIVPASVVCPKPMPEYNSWVAPTAATTPTAG